MRGAASRRGLPAGLAHVQVENLLDGAAADDAERDVVAGEHDAVGLRPVEAARLVVYPFERADCAGVRSLVQQRRVALLLVAEEPVSYTHLRAHETRHDLVCRLLLE